MLALAAIEVDLAPIAEGQIRHGEVARQAGVHLAPDQEGDRRSARDAALAACPIRRPTRRASKKGHDEWLVIVGICTHLGCVPLGHQGQYRRLVLPLPRLALRHRRPHPPGPGAEQPATFRPTTSSPTPRSGSAEGRAAWRALDLPAARPASRTGSRARLPLVGLIHVLVRRLSDAAQPQLLVDLRRHPDLHAGGADRHRHRAGDALHAARRRSPSTPSSTSCAT